MSDLVDLSVFCAEEDGRLLLSTPWACDGWRYATDGRCCVRVPSECRKPREDGRPDAAPFFSDFKPESCTTPFPPASGETKPVDCPGMYCSESDGSKYCARPTCEYCDGRGVAHPPRCQCHGSGYIDGPANEYIEGSLFGGDYLATIRTLRNVRFYVPPCDKPHLALLHFVADGGVQGVLAAIKPGGVRT